MRGLSRWQVGSGMGQSVMRQQGADGWPNGWAGVRVVLHVPIRVIPFEPGQWEEERRFDGALAIS
jgi:hypothetical protein